MIRFNKNPWCIMKIVEERKNKLVIKYTNLSANEILFSIGPLVFSIQSNLDQDSGIFYLKKTNPRFDEIVADIKSGYMFLVDEYYFRKKYYIEDAKPVNKEPIIVTVTKIESLDSGWNKIEIANTFITNTWVAEKNQIDAPGIYQVGWRVSKEGWAVVTVK